MNKDNLKKAIFHIKHNVKKKNFDMQNYRGLDDRYSPVCQSHGCIIGHCTVLDNPENLPRGETEEIYFIDWSYQFFGLSEYEPKHAVIWQFMFSSGWAYNNNTSSKKQAVKRMKYVLKHGTYPNEFFKSKFFKSGTNCKNFNLVM